MEDKIQIRRDTLANWLKVDPILLDGEMALVATDASKPTVYDSQKVGDGIHKFSELEMLGYKCLQELGYSQQFPISQYLFSREIIGLLDFSYVDALRMNKYMQVYTGNTFYGYNIYNFSICGIRTFSSGIGNSVQIKLLSSEDIIFSYTFKNKAFQIEEIYFDSPLNLTSPLVITGNFCFIQKPNDIPFRIPTVNNSTALVCLTYIPYLHNDKTIDTLSKDIDTLSKDVIGDFIFTNPYTGNNFNSVDGGDTLYSYKTNYEFMCNGIIIRSSGVGKAVELIYDNTIIKTHKYLTNNSYENILLDEPVLINDDMHLYIRKSFRWYNSAVNKEEEMASGIYPISTGLGGKPGYSPIHVDFWFIYGDRISTNERKISVLETAIKESKYIKKVNPNDEKCFKTISDALRNCDDTIDSPQYIILIYPGLYVESVNATSHPKVSFIGIDKESCIWKCTSGKYGQDPLLYDGIGTIKNLTFISTHEDYEYDESTVANIKNYCLHIDNQRVNALSEGTLTIENCYFYCEQGSALGMGGRANHHIKVINCEIDVNVPDWNVRKEFGGIYIHSYANALVEGQKATFIGNVVKTNTSLGIQVTRGKLNDILGNPTSEDRSPIEVEAYNNISYSSVNGHKASITGVKHPSCFGNSALELNT